MKSVQHGKQSYAGNPHIRILTFAALAAFVGSSGWRASAEIVGWWGFEGVPGQTAGIGTVFPNRVDASRLPAEVYARYDGAASTDYQPVFDDSIFGPYSMGDSTTSAVSRSTLRFTNSYADAGRSQGCPVRIQDSNGALDLQTFSLEGWFKMEPSDGDPGWRAIFSKGYGSNGSGDYAYTFALYYEHARSCIRAYFTARDGEGNVQHLEQRDFSDGWAVGQFEDGNWHYISLVVNGTTHVAHLFFDTWQDGTPRWIGQVDLGGNLVYNTAEPLVIGGNNLSHWQFCGSVDEVRLSDVIVNTSDGALKKRDILDGTVIGHFPMEGDCNSTVWTNYWTNPVLSAATGGEMPTFTNRENEMVHCDKDGIRIGKEVDAKCLTLNGGKVRWAAPEFLKDCVDSLTVEFFVNAKVSENANWAGIVRSEYTSGSTTFLPWNISYTQTEGTDYLACRADTDQSRNTSTILADAPLDGKWHHVALQVWRWPDNTSTTYSLYIDYELQTSGDVLGKTIYPDGTSLGFGLASTPFVGRIDEVRLTKGIIPVDGFMRLRRPPRGMIISFR